MQQAVGAPLGATSTACCANSYRFFAGAFAAVFAGALAAGLAAGFAAGFFATGIYLLLR